MVRRAFFILLFAFSSCAYAQQQLGTQCQIDPRVDGGAPITESEPLNIKYMGSESVRYSGTTPRKFDMIVFHDPGSNNCDPINMVRYGQTYDSARGGVFGYHFYIALDGTIYQGAPLSKRTNHVLAKNSRTNIPFDNGSALGISLMCGHRQVPQAQLNAAVKLGHAIQVAYGIPSNRIVGHGELQTDRSPNEGLVAARATRTSTPSGTSQVQYTMQSQSTKVLCSVTGQIPPGCSGNGCEVFASNPGLGTGTMTGPAAFDTPMQGNTGYTLPASGQTTAPTSMASSTQQPLVTGQYRPTAVQSPHVMQTDAQAWGYADMMRKDQKKKDVPNTPAKKKNQPPFQKVGGAHDSGDVQERTEEDSIFCHGNSLSDKKRKLQRSIALYTAQYRDLGTWQHVKNLSSDPETARAVALAKSIASLQQWVTACTHDQTVLRN
jgi:hypothetical protein